MLCIIYECTSENNTNCAAKKAPTSMKPGRSEIDQLLDLVTKMSA